MVSEIFIEPQQIECIEHRGALSGEKLVELADAVSVDTDNLSVQDRVLNSKLRSLPNDAFNDPKDLNKLLLRLTRRHVPSST